MYICNNSHTLSTQISMITPSGERIERLPAWIRRVTQDLKVSPVYDARFWNPPASERYQFKNKSPPPPKSARIYEAHVGISTTEHRVGTYKEFTRDTLPRIKNLGYNIIQLMAIMEHAYYACKYLMSSLNQQVEILTGSGSLWIPSHELLRCQFALWNARRAQRAH